MPTLAEKCIVRIQHKDVLLRLMKDQEQFTYEILVPQSPFMAHVSGFPPTYYASLDEAREAAELDLVKNYNYGDSLNFDWVEAGPSEAAKPLPAN